MHTGDPEGLGLGYVDLDFGCSLGWCAATIATYCPSRMMEHLIPISTQPRSETFWVTLYYHCQDLICVHAQHNLVQGSPSAWEGNMLTPKLMLHFAVSLSCDPGQQRNLEFDVNKFLSQSRWATLYINRMREASEDC